MKNLKNFYFPDSVEAALELMREDSFKSMFIAGGTGVSLSKDASIDALVDITRMGLDYIQEKGGYLHVGATTKIEDLCKSDKAKKIGNGMLCNAASNVWSHGLRNMVTLGGNIVGLRVWSDMPVVLLALDASIKVKGYDEKTIPAEDFFREHPRKALAEDELVTEIIFPKTPADSGAEFIKFARTTGDYSTLNVGCYLEFEDNKCSLARIALSAAVPLPVRCREAEAILENQEITPKLIIEAAKKARESVSPVSNLWGSAEYKSELVEKLVRRALHTCLERAKA